MNSIEKRYWTNLLKRKIGVPDLRVTNLCYYKCLTEEDRASLAISALCLDKNIYVVYYNYDIVYDYQKHTVCRKYISEGLNFLRAKKLKKLDGNSKKRR